MDKHFVLSLFMFLLFCGTESAQADSYLQLRIAPKGANGPELKISNGLANYLSATCKLQNSSKAADNDTANQLLQSAKMDLTTAAGNFYEVSKTINGNNKLSNTETAEAKESQSVLKQAGIDIPDSYVRLYTTLGNLIGAQASAIASIKYDGDDHHFNETARTVTALTITGENNVSALQVLAGPPK